MLDMSFSEIAVIGVVALVVLGPERLPKVARTAGHLFGRLQRYVATVKSDINREMETSELAKLKQEVQDAAKSFEQTVQQHTASVEKETTAISQSVEVAANPPTPVAASVASQDAMLRQQESGLVESDKALDEVRTQQLTGTGLDRSTDVAPAAHGQAILDFGIEPVRVSKPV